MPPSHQNSLMPPAPRVRHRKPSVELTQVPDPAPRLFSKAQAIIVKFSNLTNDELELLQNTTSSVSDTYEKPIEYRMRFWIAWSRTLGRAIVITRSCSNRFLRIIIRLLKNDSSGGIGEHPLRYCAFRTKVGQPFPRFNSVPTGSQCL
jgi:hypothetical protein